VESPWLTGLAIALATIACAAAGYMIGHSKDPEPAPPTVTTSHGGNSAGSSTSPTDDAQQRGYDKAFAQARGKEFSPAFARAYREAYMNVFEAAGLQPPKKIPVPDAD
jgi:hypothetical protein